MQYLAINNTDNVAISKCSIYKSADHHLCLQIVLSNSDDINIISKYLNTSTTFFLNGFKISGEMSQIVHSKDNIYIIALQGGQYIYGE